MADDRPVEDPVETVARLDKELADLRSTVLARLATMPTGTILGTLLPAAPAGALLMQGQAVSRTTYAALWQWAQSNTLVAAGLFTVGDGSTTFGLPDFRGRVVRGVAAAEAVGLLSGADTKTIATGNLPAHGHTFTTSSDGQHQHDFLTAQGGAHGGHFPGDQVLVAGGATFGVSPWNSGGVGSGTHNHSGTTAFNSNHNHTGTTDNTGSGTAFDVRQSSINVNWLIYT